MLSGPPAMQARCKAWIDSGLIPDGSKKLIVPIEAGHRRRGDCGPSLDSPMGTSYFLRLSSAIRKPLDRHDADTVAIRQRHGLGFLDENGLAGLHSQNTP